MSQCVENVGANDIVREMTGFVAPRYGGADRLRERSDKIGEPTHEVEDNVLAHMRFPKEHRTRIHGTDPLGRRDRAIKRRTDVAGVFPGQAASHWLVGAFLLERNDEWAQRRRYMTLETLAEVGENGNVSLPVVAA